MDWFLYDNGFRHERVNSLFQQHLVVCFIQDIKFTEGLTQETWFLLVLRFDITNIDKHIQETFRDQQNDTQI